MIEDEYPWVDERTLIEALPFTADWTQEQRATLAAGLAVLNGTKLQSPDVSDLAGLIIARGDAARACGWFPKACIADHARPFAKLDPNSIAALHEAKPVGTIDVVAVIDQYEFVFCLPIAVVRVVPPGSEDN